MKTVFSIDPPNTDPRRNADIFSSFLQKLIFEGLTRLEENGRVEMGLARDVDISEDGLTYVFHLRDAQWTDGTPITAYDFEYTWKKVLDKSFAAPSSFLFYPILNAPEALKGEASLDAVGIRALDAKTFEVRLSHPTPYFLSLVSFCSFFPIPAHIDQKTPDWDRKAGTEGFVCNGPYRIVHWDRNNKISVRKSSTYWNRDLVSLDGVDILIIPDEETTLNLFERGEVDLLNSVNSSLSTDALIHLKESESLALSPLGGTSFCTFNLNHPVLKNQKMRKALSLAINRPLIVENITQMDELPADRFLPLTICSNKNLSLMASFDLAKAKELFAEGTKELLAEGIDAKSILGDLVLSYENKELSRRVVQAIQQQWKDAFGFQVTLQENDFKTHVANLQRRNYGVAFYAWAAHYLDPMSILDRFKSPDSAKNYPGYNNPLYISLLNQAQASNNPTHRLALLERAEAIIVDDMPLSPIFHETQVILKNNRFQNVTLSPLGDVLFKNIQPADTQ